MCKTRPVFLQEHFGMRQTHALQITEVFLQEHRKGRLICSA